jgi:aldehyde:ferredoxin oxidoreductase
MELYDLGLIKESAVGFPLTFGSAEVLTKLTEMTAHGEGFGKELALGSKRLCEKYGRPELSMSVKGQEFPAYDSRGIQGMGLTYATSNRGACHLRSYTVASEVMGIPMKTDPHTTEGKPGLVKAFQDATAVFDSSGLCIFTSFAWTLADIQPQIQAACEGDWSMESWLSSASESGTSSASSAMRQASPREGRQSAAATLDRTSEDRAGQGARERSRQDAPQNYELRGWSRSRRASARQRSRASNQCLNVAARRDRGTRPTRVAAGRVGGRSTASSAMARRVRSRPRHYATSIKRDDRHEIRDYWCRTRRCKAAETWLRRTRARRSRSSAANRANHARMAIPMS